MICFSLSAAAEYQFYSTGERSFGTYQRSFDISGVDADKIKAKYVGGVLRLTLPKLENRLSEGRRQEIE